MILTVDVGNSNVVFGTFEGDRLQFVARFSSTQNRTADEFAVLLKSILDIHNVCIPEIEGTIISSVVPPITGTLGRAILLLTGKEPMIVGPGMKTGINILIDNPAQLGSDLLVDSVAAAAKYPKPVIIIDMGTATTLGVLTETNAMIGGCDYARESKFLWMRSPIKPHSCPILPLKRRKKLSGKIRSTACSPESFSAMPVCWTV